jgi:hypothetical protein
MDELLRYASLAGAGLPAHERHKAKIGTVRQMRRVQVESDGTLRFSAALPCNERDDLAKLSGLTFSIADDRGSRQVLLRAADAGHPPRADAAPAAAATPAPRKTRKLILLAY